MKLYRMIASLAALQVICFLLLSHLEPDFFLLHFYQTVIYLAILILFFFFEDRWAYMIGMLAPAAWLVLAFSTGLMGAGMRQLLSLGEGHGLTNAVSFLAAVSSALGVWMIVACGLRWKKEYAGLGKGWRTFGISLGIVAAYYAVLVVWFWRMIPAGMARN